MNHLGHRGNKQAGRLVSFFIVTAFTALFIIAVSIANSAGTSARTNLGYGAPASASAAALIGQFPPRVVSFTPTGVGVIRENFRIAVSDDDGWENLREVAINISPATGSSTENTLFIRYEYSDQRISMRIGTSAWRSATVYSRTILDNPMAQLYAEDCNYYYSPGRITLEISLRLKPEFSGWKSVYINAYDRDDMNGSLSIPYAFAVNPGAREPQARNVRPDSGIGYLQTFFPSYRDPDGWEDLFSLRFHINNNQNVNNSAYLIYFPHSNRLQLRNDSAPTWQGGVVGSGRTLRNSQVAVDLSSVVVTSSNRDVTLTLPLQFNPSFVGGKNIYMRAEDWAGNSSGWQNRGSYRVTNGRHMPTPTVVSPNSGRGPYKRRNRTGPANQFRAVYTDEDGFSDLNRLYFLISDRSSRRRNRVYLLYEPVSGRLFLASDRGYISNNGIVGERGALSNKQVSIDLSEVGVRLGDQWISLRMPLYFKKRFTGNWRIFMRAIDNAGNDSGWKEKGTFIINNGKRTPLPEMVLPILGRGSGGRFTARYLDADGSSDLWYLEFLINSSTSIKDAVHIAYIPASDTIALLNDDNTGSSTGSPGDSTILSNSQGSVDLSRFSVSTDSVRMILEIPVTLFPDFAGSKNIYLRARDFLGNSSGWRHLGIYTVSAGSATEAP